MLVCNPPRLGGDHNQLPRQSNRKARDRFIHSCDCIMFIILIQLLLKHFGFGWCVFVWMFFSPLGVDEGPWVFSQRLIIFQMSSVYMCLEGFSLGKLEGKFSNAVRNWRCCWKQKLSLNGWLPKESSRARRSLLRSSGQDPLKNIHNHPRIPNDLWLVAWLGWLITLCKDVLDWE